MSKRITIMIDEDIDKKLRQLQAKKIQATSESCSFSEILNDTLKKHLK
jgi:predicted CopG family antitoxin